MPVVTATPAGSSGELLEPGAQPEWAAGDWWRMRAESPDGDVEESDVVVVAATGGGYEVRTTSEFATTYDALADISWVGPRGRDLSGAQHGQPVVFYRWPLVDGATWKTTWDGREVEVVARASPNVPTPNGTEPGFTLTASADGSPYVEYNYAPSVRSWTRIAFAKEGFVVTVVGHGSGWNGTYLVGEARDALAVSSPSGPLVPPAGTFAVDGEPSALVATLWAFAEHPGALSFLIEGPDGTQDDVTVVCLPGSPCEVEHETWLPPAAGEGKYSVASSVPGPHGLTVRAVYLSERAFVSA